VKPTPENIRDALNETYLASELAKLRGQRIQLPNDIPDYFDQAEELASSLPDEMSEHAKGLKLHADMGREAYRSGDEEQVRKHFWFIASNLPHLSELRREKPLAEKARTLQSAKTSIQAHALELFRNDTEEELKTGYVVKLLHDMANSQSGRSLNVTTVRNWVSEVAPDYAKKGGRPRKPQE